MDTVMELEIGPGPQPGSYVVHVLRSVGGGEPTSNFTLDLNELVDRRPQLEESILASAVMARRVVPTTEAAIQDVGRQLFDAIFQGDVHTAYRTSVAVASDRGKGIQLVLRLSAPGLVALPWETLFDPETATYLCRKEPLVRRVPARHAPAPLTIDPPLRILGMVSSPRGLPALDVEAEKALLEDALRPQIDAGRVKISWVEPVTWSAVHDRLLSREWHVLHFIGHGTYDSDTDEGLLAFVGYDGRTHYVPASSLADLIDEADPSPRLVLLNTCSSGTGGRDDLFSGTAGALAHSGIHAVAAMQFEISDRAAIEFSRGFYTALAHGRRIDDAVRSGRIEILGLGQGTLEWVTPVLYLRGDDTRLFDVAPVTETGVVTTTDAPSVQLPVPVPVPTAPPAEDEQAQPQPPAHAADSGDVPSTIIPVIQPDSAPTPTRTGVDATTPTAFVEAISGAPPPAIPWADDETARDASTKPITVPPAAATADGPPSGTEPTDLSWSEPGQAHRPPLLGKKRLVALMVAVLAVVLIAVAVAVAAMNGRASAVEIPELDDDVTWEIAQDKLQDLRLDPSRTNQPHASIPLGRVIGTNPSEGEMVEPESPVKVYVSSGPGTVTIPPVSGLTIIAAKEAMRDAGLNPGTETHEYHPTLAVDSVIATLPEAGTPVDPGSKVDFRVSDGPDTTPPQQVTVPPVVGRSIDQAKEDVTNAGLVPRNETAIDDVDAPAGQVISSTPVEGDTVAADSPIDFNVSTGLVTVPSLIGEELATAQVRVENQGLTFTPEALSTQDCLYETSRRRVITSSLAAGERVERYSNVTVTYCPT